MEKIILENEFLKLKIFPDYGGKISSIYDKKRKKELLFQAKEELKQPKYGAAFSEYDSSGFDECFPTIDSCIYPEGERKGVVVPDHGEVWTLPWKAQKNDYEIRLEVKSKVMDYTLSKKVKLVENKILIDYTLINTGIDSMGYIWAPHILFNCDEFTKVVVPKELDRVISLEKSSTHLEHMREYSYPITVDKNNVKFDISKTEKLENGNCEKFYFLDKSEWSALKNTKTRSKVTLKVPVEKVPYLGVWRTQGGYRGDYNIALEPCTGIYDSIEDGLKRKKIEIIEKDEIKKWWLEIIVE